MSRLYDRVLAQGCRPFTARHLLEWSSEPDETRRSYAEFMKAALGREPSSAEIDEHVARSLNSAGSAVSKDVYDAGDLEDAVVISAEEVADYWATLPVGTDILDLVDVLVPQFDRLFIEFQRGHNLMEGLRSWGVLIGSERLVPGESDAQGDLWTGEEEGWMLSASLICEHRKGEPVGPVARWVVPLDEHGRAGRTDDAGIPPMFAFLPEFDHDDPPPEEAFHDFTNALGPSFVGPALFAISLMHCKNVDVRPVDPPERLSRRHERRHGRPLTRYHVLDIAPMRHVLDTEGDARTLGLRHALHICRGHFKTFAEDAPLFGKRIGTYWWPSHARGTSEEGVVEKDYRVRLDLGLGREYVEADEHAEIAPDAPEHAGRDPDLGGRGLRAHAIAQNALAAAVEGAGYTPRRPKPEEPQYDLAWEAGDVVWVAEVKSITSQNEERQLRIAVGQVLRYRQLLAEEGRTVSAMIVVEHEPTDASWASLCADEGIALLWPDHPSFASLAA